MSTYKVLHLSNDYSEYFRDYYLDISLDADFNAVEHAYKNGWYNDIASFEIDANNHNEALGYVFEATNHIDYDWRNNIKPEEGDKLLLPLAESVRSTSVGDLVVIDDKNIALVANIGFKFIPVEGFGE